MNTTQSSPEVGSPSHQKKRVNQQLKQAIRYVSWVVNLIFLLALIWALYQAFVTGNRLPAWAWLGVVALFAAAVGLMVTYIVYRWRGRTGWPTGLSPSGESRWQA